jgi:predicted kinase
MKIINPALWKQLQDINDTIRAVKSPLLIVMVGLPGSGKSFIAKQLAEVNDDIVIVSSDAIREEFYGDANDQSHNDKVFRIVNKRLKEGLIAEKKVILDATNISKKRRKALLRDLKYPKSMAIVMAVPEYICKKRDEERDRHVGPDVINRMMKNWCPPHYSEGFDFISIIYDYDNSANFYNPILALESAVQIGHDNPHHSLSIGGHMLKAGELIQEEFKAGCPFYLYAAALLHDIGKPYVKSYGEDGVAHYYNHQNYGSYLGLFYADYMKFSLEETLDFINIIYYHMEPLLSWKRSEKAHAKAIEELGYLYNDIMIVHKADINAH